MTGLLLRLAAPLQSWGEHSAFTERDTNPYPTRSGLVGLFAAAHGRPRGAPLDDLAQLRLTIRVDRPGEQIIDFHTVGGGVPPKQTPPTAEGTRRPDGTGTIVSRRHYLTDAAFTVAVSGPDTVITSLASALQTPVWAPYLGRRSCPPEQPLLITGPVDDPESMLRTVPIDRRSTAPTVRVTFIYDHHPDGTPTPSRTELNDLPVSFAPEHRLYRTAPRYVVPVELDAALCATGTRYLHRLTEYLHGAPR